MGVGKSVVRVICLFEFECLHCLNNISLHVNYIYYYDSKYGHFLYAFTIIAVKITH